MIDTQNYTQTQQTIIGTLLRDASRLGEIMTIIRPEMFLDATRRTVYKAICTLHGDNAPIDPVSVQRITGEAYGVVIKDCLAYHTDNIIWYCESLRDYSRLYVIEYLANKLLAADTIDGASACIAELNGMLAVHGSREIINVGEAIDKYVLQPQKPPEYIRWGIPQLDKDLYAELGDLVVIGGYSSSGKTLLSLQFAALLATKYRVGFFSHETANKKLADRTVSYTANIPFPALKQRTFSDEERNRIISRANTFKKLKFDYIEASGMSVSDMQAVALNKGYQVVIVDYLQLIPSTGHDLREKVTNISMGLHVMGRNHNILVIALSQLSRPERTGNKPPPPPSMSSFKESGQIEQDADIAMLLYPVDPNNNDSNRYLKVCKNKDGKHLRLELEFHGATQTLVPVKQSVQSGIAEVTRELREEAKAKQAQPAQIEFEEVQSDGELPF